MSRNFFIVAGAVAVLGGLTTNPSRAAEEINALVWCDHTDPALVEPFTTATGITVNLKEYEGTGAALALLEQSQPGDWDVMVVDSTDVKRVTARGLLAALNPADFPVADIPQAVWAPELHEIDGTLRAVPEKFGYNGIAFDKNVFSDVEAKSSATLFDPANKEKIAIYDYYLPIITKIAILVGKDPAKLTEADLPAIKEKLFALKENSALVAEVVSSQTALATGEVGMVVGGGEYTVSGLHAEKPNLDWQLLDEGDVRWQQAIAVLDGLDQEGRSDEVPPVHPVAGRAGAPRHLVVLLGDAGQHQGGADRRAEAGAALERAAELHCQVAPLHLSDRRIRPGASVALDGVFAALAVAPPRGETRVACLP